MSRGVSDTCWETGALQKFWRRARVRRQTPIVVCQAAGAEQCMERTEKQTSQQNQRGSIRGAVTEWNSRSRAVAAEGGSMRNNGSGDVVGSELDAISMSGETEESDAQMRRRRSATSTRGLCD